MARDDGAATEQVGIEIDGDDQPGAERARRRHRHRVHECAVDQPAAADAHRREDAGQGVGRAQRLDQPAACQPDLMACVEFRRNRREVRRQLLDACVLQTGLECLGEVVAADETRARQVDVEVSHDAADAEAARPLFQRIELLRGEAAADHGADRSADDHVRHDAVRREDAHHADMSEATRRAAAERQTDGRPHKSRRCLRLDRH